jgi:hypothetical protein
MIVSNYKVYKKTIINIHIQALVCALNVPLELLKQVTMNAISS